MSNYLKIFLAACAVVVVALLVVFVLMPVFNTETDDTVNASTELIEPNGNVVATN